MPTALQLINRAYRLIGVKSIGYDLSAEEADDGLTALNALLRSWQARGLNIPYVAQVNFTLTASQAAHTWGSGGDLNGTKPLLVLAAFIRHQSQDYVVRPVSDNIWSAISDKTTEGLPSRMWFQAGDTLATIRFDRVPAEAYDFHATVLQPFTTFAGLSTDDSLPDEFENAVVYNLALDLAGEHGHEPAKIVAYRALEYLDAVKAQNLANRVPQLAVDPALQRRRTLTNFTTGE